jgi:hypothetical protein
MNDREFISVKLRRCLVENHEKYLTVFHGTIPKFVGDIKLNGLEDNTSTPYQQGWYMVSTDFNSALFHANPDDNKDFVYVFEFKIPIIKNTRWFGYPWLWKGMERTKDSTWFTLMKKLPNNLIHKIHKVSYDEWINIKNIGF